MLETGTINATVSNKTSTLPSRLVTRTVSVTEVKSEKKRDTEHTHTHTKKKQTIHLEMRRSLQLNQRM